MASNSAILNASPSDEIEPPEPMFFDTRKPDILDDSNTLNYSISAGHQIVDTEKTDRSDVVTLTSTNEQFTIQSDEMLSNWSIPQSGISTTSSQLNIEYTEAMEIDLYPGEYIFE